jgi:hypothetical protein
MTDHHNKPHTDLDYDNLSKILGYPAAAIKREWEGDKWRTHGEITQLLLNRMRAAVPEQVNGLLLKSYKSPFTGSVLPLRRLGEDESIKVQWNEYTFEQGVANEVEQEGMARLHTYSSTSHGARMVRRGLAVKVEENFYRTKEGLALYRRQIEQMATSILRTHELDIVMSLLQSPAQGQVYAQLGNNQIYGMSLNMRADERLRQQVDCFGMVNKNNDNGFTNLAAFLIGQMKHNGVDPDCIVVPPHLINYYYATSKTLTRYDASGPSSAMSRDIAGGGGLGEDGFRRDTFNGLNVIDLYIQRMVGGGEQNRASELLTLPKQIGEFYPMMTCDAVEETSSFIEYTRRKRNIYIYDEDLDRIVRVDYLSALQNCHRFDAKGNPDPDDHQDISADLFVYNDENVKKTVRYWFHMDKDWLSEESVANVVTTIKNRLDKKTLETDLNDMLKLMQGPQGPQADQKTAELKRLWEKIYAVLNEAYIGTQTGTDMPPVFTVGGLFKFVTGQDYLLPIFPFSPSPVFMPRPPLDDPNVGFFERFSVMALGRPVLDRLLTFLFLRSCVNLNCMKNMHSSDIYIPIDFVLVRPYMTYSTSSVVILKMGVETGETYIAQEKFQMTTNVADRMLYANVFYYSKAIVRNPRNIIVAPNVFIQNYMHGTNTVFIHGKRDLTAIRENGGLLARGDGSMLAFATKVNDNIHRSNVLDIRGENPSIGLNKEKYSTSEFYKRFLGIRDENVADIWSNHQDYESGTFDANTVCMLGHVESSDRKVLYSCMGHLGRVTVDGIGLTRKPGMYGAKPMPSNNKA